MNIKKLKPQQRAIINGATACIWTAGAVFQELAQNVAWCWVYIALACLYFIIACSDGNEELGD